MKALALTLFLLIAACATTPRDRVVDVRPTVRTGSVADDPDDPAIWINPQDPAHSLIVVTNKVAAPKGALVVFDLEGRVRQTFAGLDRPNNVDIEYGLPLKDGPVDIAVATERLQGRQCRRRRNQ